MLRANDYLGIEDNIRRDGMAINDTAILVVGIVCVVIGIVAIYSVKKGWLK